MKRFLCLLLVLLFVPAIVLSEDYLPINDFEQNFVGGWAMYANLSNDTIYHFTLTFLDDRSVYLRTLTIINGIPKYNEISSGKWTEFLSETIILSLSGKNFYARIEDDVLHLIEADTMTGSGAFARCPDMSYAFGK